MDPELEILIGILAETDAIWAPIRDWTGVLPANVFLARERFCEIGVPWHSGALTAVGRVQAQRTLEALTAKGLVKVRRPARVQILGVKLSHEAEDSTRFTLGLAGMQTAFLYAELIAEKTRRPDESKLLSDRWFGEWGFDVQMDPEDEGQGPAHFEFGLRPALARRLVESHSDTAGRVSYALTPAGWSWVQGDEPPSDDNENPLDETGFNAYVDRVITAKSRLKNATPERSGEIGGCPFPAGFGGLEYAEWTPVFGR